MHRDAMSKRCPGGSGSEIIRLWDRTESVAFNGYRGGENEAVRLTARREPRHLNEGRRCLQKQGNTGRKDPPNGHEEEGSSPCLYAQHNRKFITLYRTWQ